MDKETVALLLMLGWCLVAQGEEFSGTVKINPVPNLPRIEDITRIDAELFYDFGHHDLDEAITVPKERFAALYEYFGDPEVDTEPIATTTNGILKVRTKDKRVHIIEWFDCGVGKLRYSLNGIRMIRSGKDVRKNDEASWLNSAILLIRKGSKELPQPPEK